MSELIPTSQAHRPHRSLREIAHAQEIRLLAIAEQSSNPEIRAYALNAAGQERKQMHRQEARVTSKAALAISALCVVAATAVSLYAALFYPRNIAWGILTASFTGAILVSILCFVFSDRLEATIAVEFFRNLMDRSGLAREQERR